MRSVTKLAELAELGADCRQWYAVARQSIADYATTGRHNPEHVADCLALFSPRCTVTRSIRNADLYLCCGRIRGDVIRSVRRSVFHWELSGRRHINGLKTSQFAAALRGDDTAVVVDVWMSAALGIDQEQLKLRSAYATASRRIASAARRLSWPPAETQAAIWGAVYRQSFQRPNVPYLDIFAALN